MHPTFKQKAVSGDIIKVTKRLPLKEWVNNPKEFVGQIVDVQGRLFIIKDVIGNTVKLKRAEFELVARPDTKEVCLN